MYVSIRSPSAKIETSGLEIESFSKYVAAVICSILAGVDG